MTSVQLDLLLRIVVLPAAAGAIAVLLARFLVTRETPRAALLAVGAAAGAVVAYLGLAGVPPWPPIDSIGWIPLATIAALVALLAVSRAPDRRPAIGVAALVVVAAGAAYLVGKPAWTRMGLGAAAPWIALSAVAVGAIAQGLTWSAERLHPAAIGGALLATTVGAALASALSHSALLGMLLGGVASVIGALTVGAVVLRVPLRGRAVMGVVALAVAALLLYAKLFASLPTTAIALLAASALAGTAIAALPSFRGRAVVAPVLALALAALAVISAHRAAATREAAFVRADTAQMMRGSVRDI